MDCNETAAVRAGFLKSFAGVCDPAFPERNIGAVMTELSGRQEPTRVLCCGHSLGWFPL